MKKIYLDYASTTPVGRAALETIQMAYQEGVLSHQGVKDTSDLLKNIIQADAADQILYLSTGTEANQVGILSLLGGMRPEKNHVLISAIEHPSIRQFKNVLRENGFEVSEIPVASDGHLDLEAFYSLYHDKVALVSVMLVNNEVGTIQPIESLGAFLKDKDTKFHVDAIQALGKMDISFSDWQVDAMSFSAHKIYGPKGLGILCLKQGIQPEPIVSPLTLNTPYIMGFKTALESIEAEKGQERPRIRELKKHLIEGLVSLDKGIEAIGDTMSPIGIVTMCFHNRSSDALLIQYDFKGVALSAGSACSSGAISASPVLLAMGLDEKKAKSCIRFSLGKDTTLEDVNWVIELTDSMLTR